MVPVRHLIDITAACVERVQGGCVCRDMDTYVLYIYIYYSCPRWDLHSATIMVVAVWLANLMATIQ